MANNSMQGKTQGKPSVDFRSPQEKGKPAQTTLHRQATGSGSAGAPAKVPNRSGAVKSNLGKEKAAGG